MEPLIETLLSLQKTDSEILKLKKRIGKIESNIANVKETLRRESNRIETLRKTREKEVLNLAEKELELKEIEEKLDSSKRKLYGGEITSSKELSQWEKNMESFEKSRDILENSVLQQMEIVETESNNLKIGEEFFGNLEKKHTKQLDIQTQEKKALEDSLYTLENKRTQLTHSLSSQELAAYEDLSTKYPDPVASLEDDTCTGCHLALPTSEVKNIRKNEGVNRCPNCGRFIYYLS